ncbi:uncharacterized protein A1O5_03364 [Cladophialophora psammophila CBS 110553]|uniref:Uncharacterized protein n=1 Tax=Cladophialophora psammophila CBS 110553 TaxID=1182543 RepID=W9WZG0_9EURO|nr:uncharacterized protein A1O5_03364 [Cladophialophora psammophila CBS 110553]EXJ73602.1 hypothetical protein A1O5_03364 [Cladophialophora psammophila CBS 110553]
MTDGAVKFIFPTRQGPPPQDHGLSEKERRSHAARVGHLGKSRAASGPSAIHHSAPRSQAIYRMHLPRRRHTSSPSFGYNVSSNSSSNFKSESTCDSSSDEERRPTPPIVVLKGNSDPFATLSVVVTPLVNQVLTFMREALYPNLYFNPFFRRLYGDSNGPINVLHDSSWLPAQTARQGWGFAAGSLNSEGQALACIASFLHNMATLLPEDGRLKMSRQALILTTKSSELLRKSLENTPSTGGGKSMLLQDQGLITHVFWLFRAAVYSDNSPSVAVHGKVLAGSMMQGFNDGIVDHLMIIQAINDDCDDASKITRRTHFDPDWYRLTVKPIWALAEQILPPIPETAFANVNPAIEIPELRRLFIASRHQAAFGEDGMQVSDEAWGPPEQKELAFAWFVTQSKYLMAKVLQI